MKSVRITLDEIDRAGSHHTLLSILKDKGFPVGGTFNLFIDWEKIKTLTFEYDFKTMERVYIWEEL